MIIFRVCIPGPISHSWHYPSQDITLEACDFQVPLVCDVNFDHLTKVLSDFSIGTVTFLPFATILISNQWGHTLTPSKYPAFHWHVLLNLASIDESSLNRLYCDGGKDFFCFLNLVIHIMLEWIPRFYYFTSLAANAHIHSIEGQIQAHKLCLCWHSPIPESTLKNHVW